MATALQMDFLKQIFAYWAKYDAPMPENQIHHLLTQEQFEKEMTLLEISGLIERSEEGVIVTPAGRSKFKVVLTGGTYDLLHKGHIITLKEAKTWGDFLLVVVARDITVKKRKRAPIHTDEQRAYLLNELKVVDVAILGDEIDHMRVVRRIKPDVVALGADQDHIKEVLEEQIKDQGLFHTKIVRLTADYEGLATTRLIEKILARDWH